MTPKSPQEFANAIRSKYPTGVAADGRPYTEINDIELSRRWVEANPEYEGAVEFPEVDMAAAFAAGGATRINAEDDVPVGANVDVERMGGQLMAIPRGPRSVMPQTASQDTSSRFMRVIKDIPSDLQETAQGLQQAGAKMGREIYDIATDDDFTLAQKFMGVLGSSAEGVASGLGEAAMGLGKTFTTPQAEERLGQIVRQAGEAVGETQIAQTVVPAVTNWYESLDKDDKLFVDSAGGMAMVVAEMFGVGKAKKPLQAVGTGIRQGAEATPEIASSLNRQATEALTQAGRAIDSRFTTSDAKLQSKIQDAYQKAVKPTIQGKQTIGQVDKYKQNVQTAVATIAERKDSLQYTDNLGEVASGRTPETLNELSQAIQQSKNKIYDEYNALATQAGEGGLQLNTASMADELDELINSQSLQLTSPEAVAYAKTVQERYRNIGQIDATTAQDVIKQYNNSLQAFYKNPTPEGATRNAVDALMVNKIRQELDEGIMDLTGEQYQTLKSQYASLKTIEKDVLNATLRDARRNQAGLIDYTDIFTGGQAVAAIASMNPAAMAGAATQRGIKSYMKYINDPNTQVKKMFEANEKIKGGQEIEPGFFERNLPNVNVGLSIQSTVRPDLIAQRMDTRDFRIITTIIDDPVTRINHEEMLRGMGLANATDDELVSFLKEVVDEFEGMADRNVLVDTGKPPTSGKAQSATTKTTDLLEEARKYDNPTDFYERMGQENLSKFREQGIKGQEQITNWWNKNIGDTKMSYGMQHRPSEGGSGFDLTDKGLMPDDFYQKPQNYIFGNEEAGKESIRAILEMRGKPEKVVTVYRATPVNELNNGDWISLSKKYAEQESLAEGVKVYPFKVKAKDIQWAGDDINEFGYFPK